MPKSLVSFPVVLFIIQLVLFEVDHISLASVAEHNDALASEGEQCIVQGSYLDVLGRSNPLVDIIDAEELCLFAILLVYKIAGINILAYQLVAPPCAPTVLCHHVAIVGASVVEVFQGE